MTIASMMPSELNRTCRSAEAIGPCGLSTPSEQPASAAAPIKPAARSAYRISDLICLGVDGIGGRFRRRVRLAQVSVGHAQTRRRRGVRGLADMVSEKGGEQREQVEDGEHEQPLRG